MAQRQKLSLQKVFDDADKHLLQFNAFRESEEKEFKRSFYSIDTRYVQGHYILLDNWREDELLQSFGRVNAPFGIAHTHQKAYEQAYKRISDRCKRIAKREGLDYEYVDASKIFQRE